MNSWKTKRSILETEMVSAIRSRKSFRKLPVPLSE